MASIRSKMVAGAALGSTSIGLLFAAFLLPSLRNDIAEGLRHQLEWTRDALQPWLTGTDLEMAPVSDAPARAGVVILRFDRTGNVVWTSPQPPRWQVPESIGHVPKPSEFLDARYVGQVSNVADRRGDSVGVAILLPTVAQRQVYLEVRTRIALGVVVLVFVSTIGGWWYGGRMSSRMAVLTRATTALADGVLIPEDLRRGNDELNELARALEATGRTFETTVENVSKLQLVRSQFLANVSHEIRTPLFSLKGFLETLIAGGIDDRAVVVPFLEKAYHHAQRLDLLLKDLIEIARIESGEMKLSFRFFPVDELLQSVRSDFADLAAQRTQKLSVKGPESPTEVMGDKDRLRQAVGNLVENALKYSPAGASVTVEALAGERSVTITVTDSGPGISQEHLPRIFERFYRVDADRSREMGGTGLGLAIVKHIVEAHGSKITVQSTLGQGTSFSFDVRR